MGEYQEEGLLGLFKNSKRAKKPVSSCHEGRYVHVVVVSVALQIYSSKQYQIESKQMSDFLMSGQLMGN